MPSVSAGKPAELAYLDRSIAQAEMVLYTNLEQVILDLGTKLGKIKSLQIVTVAFGGTDTSKNMNIAAVNTAKTLIMPLGHYADANIKAAWASATQIVATRTITGSTDTYGLQVVEFE